MGIMISKVRVSNYRSLKLVSIELGMSNLLIGQNNSGKTNFLKALNLAFSNTADVSENDVFVAQGEQLDRTKTAIIDICITPVDARGDICKEFSDFWTSVFTNTWISTSMEGNFVGIRSEIKFDSTKDSFALTRWCIREWGDSVKGANIETKKMSFNEDMRTYLQAFYMDANRDIVQDLRNRKSYFGRITSSYDLAQEAIDEIEDKLSIANETIIKSIPSLQQTKERIAAIGQTIGAASSNVEIEPLARKITDLSKGMDIVMQDGNAAAFPIAQHGYGTRSWISFLTLSAFAENQNQKLKKDDNDDNVEQFILLTMEEPEAHLHPHAQRQLYEQISLFQGQKVVSTHSPSIIAQSTLTDAIYFCKRDGMTTAIRYKAKNTHTSEEKIFREVINTRADLLFSSAVILCEGITEELALSVFFSEYFGCSPYSLGVSIIGIGGQNYKSYLSLIKDFQIPWFIFSDGEAETINTVKTAVQTVFNRDACCMPNVVILDNGEDYEEYIISEGYSNLIIDAICQHEENDKFFDFYIEHMNGKKRKGGIVRDYTKPKGRDDALVDLCHEKKAEYALPVAKKIIKNEEDNRKIPTRIDQLFTELARSIGANNAKNVKDIE